MTSLFVSHSSQDNQVTAVIVQRLRNRGFGALFVDFDPQDGIPGGRNWEQELYAQLRRADGVIFLASPASVKSPWCLVEVSLARSIGKPVIPVLVAGTDRLSVLQDVQWIDVRPAIDPSLERLFTGLDRAGLDPWDSFNWNPDRSPYPGLEAFGPEDAAVFFGRRKEIVELRDRLQRTLQRGRGQAIAVIGASGSGKSSLVGAGLLPQLVRLHDEWVVTPRFVPGELPRANLARSLSRAFATQGKHLAAADLESLLAQGSANLVELSHQLCTRSDGSSANNLLLFMDQAEELTKVAPDERARFFQLLRGALSADSPLWVVATLRSEFLSAFLVESGSGNVFDETYVLGPLTRERLPEVIEGPAQRAGIDFEAGLVQRVVQETAGGDSLPLMAYTLRQLYELSKLGRRISIADYENVGGVVGALRRQADGVLRELTKKYEREAVFNTLLQLVSIEQGGQLARRSLRIASLTPDQVEIVGGLIDARLLHLHEAEGENTVEVTHEALFRQWEPLRSTIDASRRSIEVRSEVERTARAWDDAGRDESYLPRGVRLSAATEEWGEDYSARLGSLEQTFLLASRAFANREVQAALRANRRLRRLALGLVLLLLAVGSVSIIADSQRRRAEEQQRIAADQRRVATARSLLAEANAVRESQPPTSLRLGIAAMTVDPTAEARASLIATLTQTHYAGTLTGHTAVYAVAFSPHAQILATGSFRAVTMWDVTDGAHPIRLARMPHNGLVVAAAFSRDGRTLATGDWAKTVILWDVTEKSRPRQLAILEGQSDGLATVAFSRDGRTLATVGIDKSIILWDITSRTHPTRLTSLKNTARAVSVEMAFSPNGRWLATTGSGSGPVTLWDVTNRTHPTLLATLPSQTDQGRTVAFSNDGNTLATVAGGSAVLWDVTDPAHPTRLSAVAGLYPTFSPDGTTLATVERRTVSVWDIADRAHPVRLANLTGHTDGVEAVAFDSDGSTLATGSYDQTAMLWNLADRAHPLRRATVTGSERTRGHSTAFNPDGRTVAIGGVDRPVVLWDVADQTTPVRAGTLPDTLNASSVAFSRDGRTLSIGGGDNAVALWDVADRSKPVRLGRLARNTGRVRSLSFSPDGHKLAVLPATGKIVMMWDVTDRANPIQLQPLTGFVGVIYSVTISPDGQTLAAGGLANAMLWDIADPEHPRLLARLASRTTITSGFVGAVAFAPDGKTLATGGYEGRVVLWDVTSRRSPSMLAALTDHIGPMAALAFSRDGHTLAGGSHDKTAILWNVTYRAHPFRLATLTGHAGSVDAVAFSSDGQTLGTGSSDGTATLWDTSQQTRITLHPVDFACEITGAGLTADEWRRYAPALPYQPTCVA